MEDFVPSRKKFFEMFEHIVVGAYNKELEKKCVFVVTADVSSDKFLEYASYFKTMVYIHPLFFLFEEEKFLSGRFIFYNGDDEKIIENLKKIGLCFMSVFNDPQTEPVYDEEKVKNEWA